LSRQRSSSGRMPYKQMRADQQRKNQQLRKKARANLRIIIDMPDPKTAETIRDSIRPETEAGKGFRSKTTAITRGNKVLIGITANDLVALRAASNSFLHFVSVGLKGVSAVAPFYRGRPKRVSRRRVP
jgi:tRNA threonylcarbamoyladenosine modification (KEOPS) complex  Pcc1 subunit